MHESKNPTTGTAQGGEKRDESTADATSSETLSDVEETEKVSTDKGGTGRSSMPSPDGSFDSDQSRGPKDDPGPM